MISCKDIKNSNISLYTMPGAGSPENGFEPFGASPDGFMPGPIMPDGFLDKSDKSPDLLQPFCFKPGFFVRDIHIPAAMKDEDLPGDKGLEVLHDQQIRLHG
jgi:hypothetical protein